MAGTRERSNEAPKVPRSKWVAMLHRKPTRWDVLFHRFAEALIRRYWYTQAHFTQPTLKLDGDELWDAAMQMARVFQKHTSLAGVSQITGPNHLSLFDLDPDTIAAVSKEARAVVVRALLNYVEVAQNCFVPRNHPDLELLRPRLEESIERFLRDKCMANGELRPCLENPLGDDEGYFPKSEMPADPADTSGNPRLDAYRLNVLVHDGDAPRVVKTKLLAFAKTDPFVGPEFVVYMVTGLAGAQVHAQQTRQKINEEMESIRLRDRFLFSPSRQRGLSPVELFLEQQLMASPRMKEHLQRWADENVEGIFRVTQRQDSFLTLEDLSTGRTASVLADDPARFPLRPGELIRTRIVPWEDAWRFSGVQQLLRVEGDNAEEILRRQLHPLRLHRKLDEDDPRLLAARRLVEFVHDRFVARFGHEIARFEDLSACRQALAEFHHELMHDAVLADGRPFASAWVTDVGMGFPPFSQEQFAAADQTISGPAILYDRVEGMGFIGNFREVALAMTSPAPAQAQRAAVQGLLLQSWKPGWLVKRVLLENPSRAEELLRGILGEAFSIEKNLEPLLGRLKYPNHTLPHRPTPFLVD
jgi:hypothetical protein